MRCSVVITDRITKAAYDPATSTKIIIKGPAGNAIISGADMDNDGVGLYHYDIDYVATDGPRVTVVRSYIDLIA